ncbi:MAG TPA: hypothetical protein VGJ08_01700 [Rhizomicrobium sp.]|jgi:hypothetical protein
MRRALPFAICFAAAALFTQLVRSDDSSRLHGTVSQFDGSYLTLKANSGKSVLVTVRPETRILHSRTMPLSDLKSGDFVASLSLKDSIGKLHALGLRVSQNSAERSGEGQYPAASDPTRIVTDGTVSAISVADGKIGLSFHGSSPAADGGCTGRATTGGSGCTGSADIFVARGVPIVAISTGDATLLRAGAIVSVAATTDASSSIVASTVIVERDAKPAQ